MNRNRIALSLCAVAGLMALACSTTKQVMAQARPALIKNVDEKGRNPYQVTLPCQRFQDISVCFSTIDPVPAGKRLVLQFVHASLNPYSKNSPTPVPMEIDTDTDSLVEFLPVYSPAVGRYVLNSAILFYVDAGKTVTFRAAYIAQFGYIGSVTFTGYLVAID